MKTFTFRIILPAFFLLGSCPAAEPTVKMDFNTPDQPGIAIRKHAKIENGVLKLTDWPKAPVTLNRKEPFKITYRMKITKRKAPKCHFGFNIVSGNKTAFFHTDAENFIGLLLEDGRQKSGTWPKRGLKSPFKPDDWNTIEIMVRKSMISVNVNGRNSINARFEILPAAEFTFHAYNYSYDVDDFSVEPLAEQESIPEKAAVFSAPFDGTTEAVGRGGIKITPALMKDVLFRSGVAGKGISLIPGKGGLEYPLSRPFDSRIGGFMFWCRINDSGGGKLFSFANAENDVIAVDMAGDRISIRVKRTDDPRPLLYTRTLPGKPEAGDWYHIALSWDSGGSARFYVNGLPWWVSFTPGQRAPDFISADVNGVTRLKFHNTASHTTAGLKIFHRPLTNREVSGAYREIMPFDLVADRGILPAGAPCRPSILAAPAGYYTRPRPIPLKENPPVNAEIAFELKNSAGKLIFAEKQRLKVGKPEELTLKEVTLPRGHYALTCTVRHNGREYQRTFPVVAAGDCEPGKESEEDLRLGSLLYEKRFENAADPRIRKEGPAVFKNGYLEAGARKGERFGFEIPFPDEVMGKPVVLEVEWPDDAVRSMGLYMYPYGISCNRDRLQSGIQSGREYPNSGKMVKTRHIFYPGAEKYLFEARTMAEGRPAAVSAVRVYAIDGGLPKLAVRKPEGLPNRRFGHADEDQTFTSNLNMDAYISRTLPASRELRKKYPAADVFFTNELIRYFGYSGMNTMHYPLWRYTVSFTPQEGATDCGLYAGKPGALPWIFKQFAANDLKFIAKLYYTNLPDAGIYDKLDPEDREAGLVSQNRYGDTSNDPVRSGKVVANIAHPKTFSILAGYFEDAVRRYAKAPGFDGIAYLPSGTGSWLSLEWGYDDYTVNRFSRETGIKVPAELRKRYDYLTSGDRRAAWLKWRAGIVTEMIRGVRKVLDRENKSLKLFAELPDRADRYEQNGFDAEEIAKIPGIELILSANVTEHRWRAHWGLPEDETLENHFDYNRPDFKKIRESGSVGCICNYNRYHETFTAPVDRAYKCEFENSDPKPHGRFFLRDHAFAVGSFDALEYVQGGQPLPTVGRDAESREFAKAFCALPALPFKQIPGIHDPAAARQLNTKNGTYFYIVNLFHEPVTVRLSFDKSGEYLDLSSGRRSKSREFSLKPFELRSFLFEKQNIKAEKIEFVSTAPDAGSFYENRIAELKRCEGILRKAGIDAEKESGVIAAMENALKRRQWAELYRLAFSRRMNGLPVKASNLGRLAKRDEMLRGNRISVNCGGTEFVQKENGDLFFPDQAFDGTFGYFGNRDAITRSPEKNDSTVYPELYRSEAYNIDGYRFKVQPGKYIVRMYFKIGFRPDARKDFFVFNVSANGKPLLQDFDLFPACGNDFNGTAVKEFPVTLGDGTLELKFSTDGKHYPTSRLLNGVELFPAEKESAPPVSPKKLQADYTEEKSCGMESPAWDAAPAYQLKPQSFSAFFREIQERSGMTGRLLESGRIRLLWNEKALYVRCDAVDSDLVDEAKTDQTHLFSAADTVEVFLHAKSAPGYFEIFGSAGGHKTSYFFPGRGRLSIPSSNAFQMPGLAVQVKTDGTLNQWNDRDNGFSIIIRIPAAPLAKLSGTEWGKNGGWTILVSRWNYSRYLPACEISVSGEFSARNPHIYEDYAEIIFQK